MLNYVGQQIGNYRLLRILGQGGFAQVYLGEHRYLKSAAALKVLQRSLTQKETERFLEEARMLVRLRHAHIVRVLDYAVERGTPVLIMDYVPGGTLRQRYPAGTRLPLDMTIHYGTQLASALQYAHNQHVIHRDVKPENMLLDAEQQLLLSDFGLALLASSSERLSTQTVAGTPSYLAPEQLLGKPCFASDQYALGVVTYEWLTGVRPFQGKAWELYHQHLTTPPPPLRERCPELPAAVEQVVLKALAKEPQERYVSVSAFAQALQRAACEDRSDDEDSQRTAPLVVRTSVPATQSSPQHERIARAVFLSASPSDEPAAARLAADLKQRGVELTSERADADTLQEKNLQAAIRAAQHLVIVVTPQTRSSRRVREHLRLAQMYQRRLVLVWMQGEEMAGLLLDPLWQLFLPVDVVDARGSRYQAALDELLACLREETHVADFEQVITSTTPEEPRNPYKGLRAFREEDALDFFGRDALLEAMIALLKSILAEEQKGTAGSRLLTLVGPSGSGKSSVVQAGLLPHLQAGVLPGSENWVYLKSMVPGTHPLESLALTLAPHLPDRSMKALHEDLQDDSARGLHRLCTQLATGPDCRVVLVVDQFEELFTQTLSEEERRNFVDLLVTAVTEKAGPLLVLLTLRVDFYGHPMRYPHLYQLIEAHHQSILPMETHDLRAVIEEPAALPDVQLTFEGNLVGDLLFETQGQIGALPLLEFTLDQLFQQREGQIVTLDAYRRLGGVKGALVKHAEATYAALPSEEHRRLARALFLRLIEPGLNEQDTTRRRAVLSELALPDAKQTALLWEVANAFVAARLITTNELAGTTTIEVSHEALIGAWPRLTEWLREGREDIHLQQAVSQDVEEWERRGKPKDRLYRGSQLREANAWAMRNLPSSNEAAFLQASTAYRSRSRVVVTAIVLLVLLLAIPAALLVRSFVLTNVVTTADDEGPGSLRQVIANARQGSIITFAANVKGPIILTGRDLVIDRSLTIRGPGTYPLAITGGKSGHRVSVSAGNTVTISDVSFINSLTDKVGWAFLENQGNLTLINSTVAGNTSLGIGGGIMNNSNGRLTLLNSTVSGNSAKIGGGIYNLGILTISNSTISGNTASRVGGGIYDFGGQESITFCTLYGNTAPEGGGIFIEGKNNHVEMRASIIAGNHADTQPDIAGQLTLNGYNLIQNPAHATLVERGPISLDLIGVSPTVGPLQENGGPTKTHALLAGSPAIDRVPRDVCLATDQRGIKRPQGSACDIGAYE